MNVLFRLFTAVVVAGCGLINPKKFSEGFYVYDGDATTVGYPLAVIRFKSVRGTELHSAFVDRKSGSFSHGSSTSDASSDEITTSIVGTVNQIDGPVHFGAVKAQGETLAIKEMTAASGDPDSRKRGTVTKEYVLKKVSKEEAIQKLRKLVKITEGAAKAFSPNQEEVCNLAFDMSCTALIGK